MRATYLRKQTNRLVIFVLLDLILTAADCSCGAVPAKEKGSESDLGQYFGFGAMEILKLQWQIGTPLVADLNHDGLNDLIVVNNRKARIELLLQKNNFQPGQVLADEIENNDINDIFGQERNWRFQRISFPLDVAAVNLVVADLNHDTFLDLAFYAKDGLRIALQQPVDNPDKDTDSPRAPVWSPTQRIDVRGGLGGSKSLAAGDLNGDQLTDLVLLTSDGFFLIRQKPDHSPAQPIQYHSAARQLRQVEIADVNADGRNDLVLLSATLEHYPLRIRLQNPDGKLGPEMRQHIPVPLALEMQSLSDASPSYFFTISQQGGRVLISALPPRPDSETYPLYSYPLADTEKSENRDIISADVNGDGLLDVVVSDPSRAEFLLYRAHPETSLTTPETFPGLKDMRKLCAGRLDNTFQDSLVVLSYEEKIIALSRLQNSRLTFPETVAIIGEPQAMDLADINNDKKLDLVYIAKEKDKQTSRDKFTLRTILSLGRPESVEGATLDLPQIKDRPSDLRVADIDHDSRPDVMIIQTYGPLLLLRQQEAQTFTAEAQNAMHAGLVSKVSPQALSIAALGPKQTPAALLVRKNFARALIFNPKQGWQVVDQYQAAQPQSNLTAALACRLQPNGPTHIVTYDAAYRKLALFAPQPDNTYRIEKQIEVGAVSAKKILAGNFGGSTPVSLLLCGSKQLLRIPVVEQTYSLRRLADFEPDIKDGRYGTLTVGDINHDGGPDIILCEQAKHHVEILTFDGQARLVCATKFKVFEQPPALEESAFDEGRRKDAGQPRSATIGDVTGDGKNDLILQIHDRIIIYPQE